jgi:ABC-type proline/glycine betaine transport system ATPase subunit
MEHYGILRDFMGQAAFFETEHARHMLKELKLAIKLGKLVVLSGIGGCGKTTMLRRVQESIEQEREILVSKALAVEKSQIHLGGLPEEPSAAAPNVTALIRLRAKRWRLVLRVSPAAPVSKAGLIFLETACSATDVIATTA